MSTKYNCAIFDLDGTLLDTERGIVCALDEMTEYAGLDNIGAEDYWRFIGPPIEDSVRIYFGLNEFESAAAAHAFRTAYSQKYLFDATAYEGIHGALDNLRASGLRLAIATNKRHSYATTLIEHFKLHEYFSIYLGSDPELRPNKVTSIDACLASLDADRTRSVYVGDTKSDETSAAQVGIDFIGVTYGFGFKPGTVGPRRAESPHHVEDLILQKGSHAA